MSNFELGNISALHYYLDELYSTSDSAPLHMFIALSKVPIEKIESYAYRHSRSISYKEIEKNFYKMELRIRTRGAEGWLVTRGELWIFYMRSDEGANIGDVVEKWIDGMFPFISSAKIPSKNIYDMLDDLNRASKQGIEIADYLSRRYLGKKQWASQKNWPKQNYVREELEERVANDDHFLDSVRLKFTSDEESFSCAFSKNGHLTYYQGGKRGFSNFYRLVVDNYIEKAFMHLKSFENKEAKISHKAENVVFPLRYLQTREDTFTLDRFEKMVKATRSAGDYLVSVIHKGNPWLYLTLLDREDGSNFEIYGFDDKIEIVPMLRATPESLARIEDLVYEVFPTIRREA